MGFERVPWSRGPSKVRASGISRRSCHPEQVPELFTGTQSKDHGYTSKFARSMGRARTVRVLSSKNLAVIPPRRTAEKAVLCSGCDNRDFCLRRVQNLPTWFITSTFCQPKRRSLHRSHQPTRRSSRSTQTKTHPRFCKKVRRCSPGLFRAILRRAQRHQSQKTN
jgi:hypothetical protein